MGAAMAANLVAAGHAVTVYNRSPAKAAPLVEKGARLAASVAEACRGDAVVTMLADDRAVGDGRPRRRGHRGEPGRRVRSMSR